LRLATELALRATGAAGCAIAMRAGGGFRCYASVGEAPPANTPVRLAGTLTGLCVRKAKTIRRDDVAEEEAQQSGYAGEARSIVLAPIFQDGNVGGVIGIFSPEPHSFLDEHVTALEQISNVIAVGMLHPERLESAPPSTVAVVQPETRQPDFMPEAIAAQTRALEGLARVITNALLHQQRPALTAEASNPEASAPGAAGAPQKKLYGLPCGKCGAYSPSKEPICTVCNQPR
jgi:GAF domain-containing protein